MRVSGILASKGTTVATIAPRASVAEAADALRRHGIGALVVSADGDVIDGIISERDIVFRLAETGEQVLREPVSAVMTAEVRTCSMHDTCDELMRVMTEQRTRHLPVVADGKLAGIVSIGDVVKRRVTELEDETRQMHDYIVTGR
jgi:CBS domain-containing protein